MRTLFLNWSAKKERGFGGERTSANRAAINLHTTSVDLVFPRSVLVRNAPISICLVSFGGWWGLLDMLLEGEIGLKKNFERSI